jgi:Protein of unknown function (DUF2905)
VRPRTLAGLAMILFGLLILLSQRWPMIRLGRLPGDIALRSKTGDFYFPIVSCLVISALLSLMFWLFRKR